MDTDLVPVKKKVGAPSSYREEYCEQIISYFEARAAEPGRTVEESITETDDSRGNSTKRETRRITAELPTLEGFARSIGTSRKTLLEWSTRHPAFGIACARAKDLQCAVLTDRALNGQYNAQYAQFVAKNVTWMKDKVEVETTQSTDSIGMDHMRKVLSSASPDQLQRFASLMEEMEAGVPKQFESNQ